MRNLINLPGPSSITALESVEPNQFSDTVVASLAKI